MIYVRSSVLPDAWEKSLVELWRNGSLIMTEYDQVSIDSPAVIIVDSPLNEPRIHLKGCIAGLNGLRKYVEEILYGVESKWEYTYHERIFSYLPPVFKNDEVEVERLNQIDYVVRKLKNAPYSRRAVVVIWQPWVDENTDYPPCLVYLWFRIINEKLEMHVHMRSNDALKASFMNMYAYTELQKYVADRLGCGVGRYVHVADSYHVYERDWLWFEKFVEQVESGESKKYWR